MSPILEILIALAAAAAGSILFIRLKVPAGALVGALIVSSLLKITTGIGMMPREVKTAVQIVAGAFVGQRVRRQDLKEMYTIVKPMIVYLICVVALILGMGHLIAQTTILDLPTALLSILPGGITEISMISEELGGNPTQTTVLQMSRYIFSLLILPQVDSLICRRWDKQQDGVELDKSSQRKTPYDFIITIAACTAAGLLGKASGFPAGTLLFSLIAAAAINLRTGRAHMPRPIRYGAQTCAGCLLGVTITMAEIQRFPTLALPVALILVNCLLINFGVGALLHRISGFSWATCLFSCVPAGMSDMALISLDIGGDSPKVMALQLARYLLVLAVMPSVIRLIAGRL